MDTMPSAKLFFLLFFSHFFQSYLLSSCLSDSFFSILSFSKEIRFISFEIIITTIVTDLLACVIGHTLCINTTPASAQRLNACFNTLPASAHCLLPHNACFNTTPASTQRLLPHNVCFDKSPSTAPHIITEAPNLNFFFSNAPEQMQQFCTTNRKHPLANKDIPSSQALYDSGCPFPPKLAPLFVLTKVSRVVADVESGLFFALRKSSVLFLFFFLFFLLDSR